MYNSVIEMNDTEYFLYKKALHERNNRINAFRKIIILMISVFGLVIVLGCFTSKARDERKISVSKYYTYINLPYDESIADVAYEYYNSASYSNCKYYDSAEDYLEEIKEINHLNNDTVISGGKLLYIPYYIESYSLNN